VIIPPLPLAPAARIECTAAKRQKMLSVLSPREIDQLNRLTGKLIAHVGSGAWREAD
jgi:hypothetical protein